NRFVNLWNAAPVFAAMEADVIRWLCGMFDYPMEARGILTSGGSMSNLSAIVTARAAKLGEEFADGCIYVTEQTHASVAKAAGIDRADSITLDPHKTLFLPYGTGVLLVRDGEKLRQAHRAKGDYLQDLSPEGDIPNFTDYSPELSRDFRGLRVWLPLKLHGIEAFRMALNEKLDLTRLLYEALTREPGFDVPWEPELTV